MNYLMGPDHIPYLVDTSTTEGFIEWAKGFDVKSRRVEWTPIVGKAFVSTVFLGIDHSFSEGGPPILFETMCFDINWREKFSRRYATWGEAIQGHSEVLKEFSKYVREHGSRNMREGRYMERIKRVKK